VIRGHVASGAFEQPIEMSAGNNSPENGALRYLWARHRIMRLADMNKLAPSDERVKEVTTLGLTYNLMTDYTSFVAVDTVSGPMGRRWSRYASPCRCRKA